MQAETLAKLDEIFEVMEHHGRDFAASELCEFFFPDKGVEGSDRYIRRLLHDDLRFVESRPGVWSLQEQDLAHIALKDLRYCVFDFETTGGTPPLHKAIELGAVLIEGGRITSSFKSLIQPNRQIPDYVVRLTGIRDSDLRNAPELNDVLSEFLQFMDGTILIAHNALFDINFLSYELQRVLQSGFQNLGLCTLKMSRDLIKDSPAHKLDVLSTHLGLELADRHRAWDDANATAQLFLRMLTMLEEKGITHLAQIRKFLVRPRSDYFPSCLMGPDEAEKLPQGCGVILFKDRHGRLIHSQPFRRMRQELSQLLFQDFRNSRLKLIWRKAESYEVVPAPSYFEAVLQSASFRGQQVRGGGLHQYFAVVPDPSKDLVTTVNRLPRKGTWFYGPFESEVTLLRLLNEIGTSLPMPRGMFPVRLGYKHLYQVPKPLSSSLARLGRSSLELSYVVVVPKSEAGLEFYFLKDGQVLSQWHTASLYETQLQEKLAEIYDSVYLNTPAAKKAPSRKVTTVDPESIALMEWLQHEAHLDRSCRVLSVNLQEPLAAPHFVADMMLRIMDLA